MKLNAGIKLMMGVGRSEYLHRAGHSHVGACEP